MRVEGGEGEGGRCGWKGGRERGITLTRSFTQLNTLAEGPECCCILPLQPNDPHIDHTAPHFLILAQSGLSVAAFSPGIQPMEVSAVSERQVSSSSGSHCCSGVGGGRGEGGG